MSTIIEQSHSADPFAPLRSVRIWLWIVAFLIALMVLVGGATRLTDSGLSITQWDPISGAIPPLNQAAWLLEFSKYQTTTEYQTVNFGMSLSQFQFIYWWEWGHRFLGRLIGLAVFIPLVWFWLRGHLTSWLKPRLVILLLLGGFQGFIGWWMVKSGLVNRVDVSQIRLAVHLTMACFLFAMAVWLARSISYHSGEPLYGKRGQALALIALVLLQIFIGGLVAGLDAGMAYNTWPDMNGQLIPQGLWAMSPAWENLLDNAVTVQFFHRLTAYLLWAVCLLHAMILWKNAPSTPHMRRAVLLAVIVSLQAALGIVTLVLQVPLGFALAHQFFALFVLALSVAHWRALVPKQAASL